MSDRKGVGGRKRKGTLEWTKSGWRGRLTLEVDGETIRKWFPLGTDNKAVARRKMARLLADTQAKSPAELASLALRGETFTEAAKRILDRREADGVRDVKNERSRCKLYLEPAIGHMPVGDIKSSHIKELLEEARDDEKSHQTLKNIRMVALAIFDPLWRDEVIPENPVARVKVPKGKKDRRERAVLHDSELAQYLGWQHPIEQHRLAVLERQTMSCVSRMFGGLRTGDLHAITWENFVVADGAFEFGWAPRKKTERPQLLAVPKMLRPILNDWWKRSGSPAKGFMFPALRGAGAGEGAKQGVSHAKAFRRDLKRAFGLEMYDEQKQLWQAVKPEVYSNRHRELFTNTEQTRRVDFHSWRRSFNQALATAGVNAQSAMALAGHGDMGAHQRYLNNTGTALELPEKALPVLSVSFAPILETLAETTVQGIPNATLNVCNDCTPQVTWRSHNPKVVGSNPARATAAPLTSLSAGFSTFGAAVARVGFERPKLRLVRSFQ